MKYQQKELTFIQHKLITILLSILSGATAAVLFLNGKHDNDYLWHIRTGEYFLKQGHLFQKDIFSWLSPELNLQATMHSWLTDVVFALIQSVTKNLYITGAIFCFFITTLFSYMIGVLFYKEHSWFTTIFSFLIGFLCCNPRPQLIGNCFFVLTIYILVDSFHKKNSKWIWFLPFLSILWANFHGGTLPMLFAFEGLFFILGLCPTFSIGKLKLNRDSKICVINFKNIKQHFTYPLKMGVILCLSLLTGLCNPYGWKLYIYFCITNNEITKQFIKEWQPGTLNSGYTIILFILLITPLLFLKKKVPLEKWLLPFICLILGAMHQRILIYGIFAALPLFTEITERFSYKKNPYAFKDMLCIIFGFSIIVAIFALSITKEHFHIPKEMITYLQESECHRLYNTYNDGAELIWNDIPVFIDSRGDLYPEEIIKGAVYFDKAGFEKVGDMQKFLQEYDFDILLLSKDSVATIELLSYDTNWKLVFQKDKYYIFEKIKNK